MLLRMLLIVTSLLLGTGARAAAPLVLQEGVDVVDAWPALTVLADPTLSLSLEQVRQRVGEFGVADVPRGNFGVRHDALWLRLPLQVPDASGAWVLEIDYPPLNRVDLHLVSDGRPVLHRVLGNAQPFDQRPMRTRAHAVTLDLPAGSQHEVYLRVQSTSSMLVPIRLYRADSFLSHESGRQMLQGLMIGIALALLAYSVANGLSLGDPLFAMYALMVLGVTTFFVSYSGIGQQHLWSEQTGLLAKIAPLGALLAVSACSLFASAALQAPRTQRWLALGLNAIAGLGIVVFVASLVGLLDYRSTQAAATVLGPIPVLLALRLAWQRGRDGDRVARLMGLGWTAYIVGALSMAGLLRGVLPADFWVLHLFQFSSLVEMLVWVRVLGLRIEGIQRDAQRAEGERRALHSLAHTDSLTGLPNRRGLNSALEAALAQARPDSTLAVFLLDLDGFKGVNDRFGHDTGDELLVQVARRLRGLLRSGDVVARLGGDEFVVLSPGLSNEGDAQRVGNKLLEAFLEPFAVAGQSCRVGLTVGFALAPHDGRDGGDLLRRADAAMYAGKQAGRSCLRRGGASVGLAGT